MKRISILLLLLLLAIGCDSNPPAGKQDAGEPEKTASVSQADDFTAKVQEELQAQMEKMRPSDDDKAYLEAAISTNADNSPNGIFTNQDGISGYFSNYDAPFNFRWTGGTKEVTAFDGRTYQMLDGPGRLLVKHKGAETLLQLYDGSFSEGRWHGQGDLLSWDETECDGSNGFFSHYTGEFQYDRETGQGREVLIWFDCSYRPVIAVEYDGEMLKGASNGKGVRTNLLSGQVIHDGLWLEGDSFVGSSEEWSTANEMLNLRSAERQLIGMMMTGALNLGGYENSQPGQGALTIIMPQEAHSVSLRDQFGRSYTTGPVIYISQKNDDKEEVTGLGAIVDAKEEDYPLTLTMDYDLRGRKEYLRFTVAKPFTCILEEQ